MTKYSVECVRRIVERETIVFEADNVATALNMAAQAYTRGATEEQPHEYKWDDCGDVQELEFAVFDDKEALLIQDIGLCEAEDFTVEDLARYGVGA